MGLESGGTAGIEEDQSDAGGGHSGLGRHSAGRRHESLHLRVGGGCAPVSEEQGR